MTIRRESTTLPSSHIRRPA